MRSIHRLVLGCGLFLASTLAASAEPWSGHRVGDRYQLLLRTETATEAVSRAAKRQTFDERVQLAYDATVVVLEADESGRPVRERHQDVSLVVDRSEGTGSLFRRGTSFEVRRENDALAIYVEDVRISPEIERLVTDVLRERSHRPDFADSLEPTPEVAAGGGGRWELEPDRAARILAAHGLAIEELADAPTATLEVREGRRSVHYRIPVRGLDVGNLPLGAAVDRSDAVLEGRLEWPEESGSPEIAHSSNLELSLRGSIERRAPAVVWSHYDASSDTDEAPPIAHFELDRAHRVDQRIVPLDEVARSR